MFPNDDEISQLKYRTSVNDLLKMCCIILNILQKRCCELRLFEEKMRLITNFVIELYPT